jgi:hypothetical protein
LDNYGPPQSSSTGAGGRSWFAVGNGACPSAPTTCTDGYDGFISTVKLYSTTPTMTVRLVSPSGGCGIEDNNSDSNSTVFSFLDETSSLPVRADAIFRNNGATCGISDLNVNGVASTLANGYYVSTVIVTLGGLTPYLENSFRINIISNAANSFVSIPNSTSSGGNRVADMTGIYQKDNPVGTYWTQSVVFATPCGQPTFPSNLRWFDADFSQYGQNNPANQLTMTLEAKPRNGSGTWSTVDTWTGSPAVGDSGYPGSLRSRPFTFNSDFKYRWTWINVSQINTIQLGLPFDQMHTLKTDCRVDLCTNLNGVQATVPSGMLKTTPGSQPGICYTPGTTNPLTDGECYINSASFSYGQFDSASYDVVTRNTGNTRWVDTRGTATPNDDRSNIYISTNGSPQVGNFSIFADPATRILPTILNPGGTASINFGLNTSNIGSFSFTYHIYRVRSAPLFWERLNTCTMDYVITPPIPAGEIGANCGQVYGRLYYQGGAYGQPVSGYISYIDRRNGLEAARDNFSSTDGFSRAMYISASSGLKPYLNYRVELHAIVNGVDQIIYDGNPGDQEPTNCMTMNCRVNPTGPLEIGRRLSVARGATVSNNTQHPYGMYASITPSGGIFNAVGSGGNQSAVNSVPAPQSVVPGFATLENTSIVYATGAGKFLIDVYINYGTGYVIANDVPNFGSCDSVYSPPNPDGGEEIIDAVAWPYVKAYGADVVAGGGFGTSCSALSGIFARMRPLQEQIGASSTPANNGKGGSGSQLGSFAWGDNTSNGDITGFTGASMRNATPNAVAGNGLTFGGVAVNPLLSEPKVGGDLGGNPACIPDYYNDTQYPVGNPVRIAGSPGNINPSIFNNSNDNKQIFYTGYKNIIQLANYIGKRTIYVEGDVGISGNIIYNNASDFVTIANIPNFTLVVRGNIYIAPGVTQLDGLYIAQPNTSNLTTTGRIYTCADVTPITASAYTTQLAVYDNCSGGYGVPGRNVPKLVVNGSFVAQKVILNRAVNTLDNSTFRETAANSQAAETFRFSPELILSPPIFRPIGGLTSGSYQSIAILPPIL